MAQTWFPIQWQSLGSAAASITLSSIPAGYRDLRLVLNLTTTAAVGGGVVINSDTTSANYSWVQMLGDGTTTVSNTGALASGSLQFEPNFNFSTTAPTTVTLDFLDYAQTDKHKTIVWRGSLASAGVNAIAARWASTAAINSLVIQTNSSTFAAGTTVALYGIAG